MLMIKKGVAWIYAGHTNGFYLTMDKESPLAHVLYNNVGYPILTTETDIDNFHFTLERCHLDRQWVITKNHTEIAMEPRGGLVEFKIALPDDIIRIQLDVNVLEELRWMFRLRRLMVEHGTPWALS